MVRVLLLVDDEENILSSLRRVLSNDRYKILTANSARIAMKLLKENDVGVILSDQCMPGMTGVELMSNVKELYPDTVRLMLSGYADIKSVTDAINHGAISKFLVKPCDNDLLRKNIREAFEQYELKLENERLTRELIVTNKDLDDALTKSKQATQAKSVFLANMSHELRTPMNGVLGMSDLLLETSLQTEQLGYIEAIKSSGNLLLGVINDILDLSKVEAGKLVLEEVDFNLRRTIDEVAELLAIQAHNKGIELISLIERDVPESVHGDPTRLRQIITNLVSNAIKFTSQGEVAINVKAIEEEDARVLLRFEVKDTGIGIGESDKEKIFDSYSQANGSTTRLYGGTGLGLAICQQLVRAMEGEIGIESTEGIGSTFWFTAHINTIVESETRTLDTEFRNFRVLIVDDNETARTALGQYLDSWGISVGSARNGDEALERLKMADRSMQPYRIALIDMFMPGMDGLELSRAIRMAADISPMQTVLMIPFGQRGSREDAVEAGVTTYLTKPLRKSTLYDCIVKLLETEKSGEVDEERPSSPLEKGPIFTGSVLVVDDNIVNQKVAQAMLKKLGVEVDVASTGREALNILSDEYYDLVFMDCQMPELDGFEATRIIREREAEHVEFQDKTKNNPRIKIVAMTANAMQGDREKCIAADMDDYISKPVSEKDFTEVLKRCLNVETLCTGKYDLDEQQKFNCIEGKTL